MYQNNFGNFQTSFQQFPQSNVNGYDPKIMFKHNNFINKNELRYNNLEQILLNEEIREYSILVDSKDRNYQIYPNPYKYDVKFNPLPTTREKIKGKIVVYEDPNPVINQSFENVRYIRLEEAIMPIYNKTKNISKKIREDESDDEDNIVITPQVDTKNAITDNLYTVLNIKEFSDVNTRSTNDVLSESFATIYFDHQISNTHYSGICRNGVKIFNQDELGKIDSFKISFMDPYGNVLNVNGMDKNIKSNMECECDEDYVDEECFKHNLYHPLNPIFQHHLHFKVGVVEPRLLKKNFN